MASLHQQIVGIAFIQFVADKPEHEEIEDTASSVPTNIQ